MRTIHRYEIPVDDQWHPLELTCPILHTAARTPYSVEIWVRASSDGVAGANSYRVVGTGHPWPDDAQYVGTAITPGGQYVWHLLQRFASLQFPA